jgi:spermidine synthase
MLSSGWKNNVIHAERSFFGVMKVTLEEEGKYRAFMHGSTMHGAQSLDPSRIREPLTYYYNSGPLESIFTAYPGDGTGRRVAVIGLGIGTLALYAEPGESWTFYEIDPAVERIARNPQYFNCLEESPALVDIVLGDARLSVADAPDEYYDLFVVDAFSSDAIPVHLVTRESLRLYLSKLRKGGIIVFNITNRHVNLEPVLAALAQEARLTGLVRTDPNHDFKAMRYASTWAVLAREASDINRLLSGSSFWQPLQTKPGVAAWTDDFSNIVSVLNWL